VVQSNRGNALAVLAFIVWGIIPLYYQLLPDADTGELLALRIIMTVPLMGLVMKLFNCPLLSLAKIWADKKSLLMCLLASCVMSISWYAFIWALTNGQVMAASLGFFINPLFVILLGVLFLHEKLTPGQKVAVLFGIAGLSFQVWHYGELPWLALVMGGFFALFGLCKKWIKYDPMTAVTVEAALLVPFAVAFMGWKYSLGISDALNHNMTTFMLYAGSAPVTLLPLLLFSIAVRYTSLTMIGIFQYIEPTLQFLLALFLFGEVFDEVKGISFALIWCGLIICTIEALLRHRKKQKTLVHSLQ
jgi:chloramphenicol-sensitive protein RarD